MRNILGVLFFCLSALCVAQPKTIETVFVKADSLYREDQFYLGLTYNRLLKTPMNIVQNGLSIGVNTGFLRDFPFNKSRTFAIAAGLGFSYNKYHQNLGVFKTGEGFDYEVLDNASFDRNKLEQVGIEIPIEFRWRNSTPTRHRFFRIYGGFKCSYLVFNKTKFVGSFSEVTINNSDFNTFQYGPTLSLGYNTWNLHAYYGLNPVFKSAVLNSSNIQMSTLNLGIIFYIL
jgi:hypothetical protein